MKYTIKKFELKVPNNNKSVLLFDTNINELIQKKCDFCHRSDTPKFAIHIYLDEENYYIGECFKHFNEKYSKKKEPAKTKYIS